MSECVVEQVVECVECVSECMSEGEGEQMRV